MGVSVKLPRRARTSEVVPARGGGFHPEYVLSQRESERKEYGSWASCVHSARVRRPRSARARVVNSSCGVIIATVTSSWSTMPHRTASSDVQLHILLERLRRSLYLVHCCMKRERNGDARSATRAICDAMVESFSAQDEAEQEETTEENNSGGAGHSSATPRAGGTSTWRWNCTA